MSDDDVGLLARQAYWDKGDMESLFAEILRARASETEKAAEIERLKAHETRHIGTIHEQHNLVLSLRADIERLNTELARLTPSGQVAEDRNIVAMELGSHPSQAKTQAAAARLATKAQGYEAMKVERDAAVAESSTHLEWMKEERTRAEQAEKERDAAIARAEEAEKQARLAWERHAEKDRDYGDMIAQRDATVANNAAQREVFRHILERFESPFGGTADDRMRATVAACTQALARPHPGAALLEERQEREETIKALEGALTTIAERGVSSTDRRIARDALRLAGRLR